MTIDEAKQLFDYICRKNNSGFIKPSDFNMIMNRASRTLFLSKLGMEQQYQVGRPVPVVAFDSNRRIDESLKVFIEPDYKIQVVDGKASYPSNWVYPSNAYYTKLTKKECGEGYDSEMIELELLENAIGVYRQTSKIVKPNLSKPIAITKNTYMKVLPSTIPYIYVDYLKVPDDMVWGFTEVNNRPVYDPNTSVDPLWNDIDMNMVVTLALGYTGISIKDADIMQYVQMMKQEGI